MLSFAKPCVMRAPIRSDSEIAVLRIALIVTLLHKVNCAVGHGFDRPAAGQCETQRSHVPISASVRSSGGVGRLREPRHDL